MDELSTKCDVPDETIMELALSYSKNKASSIIPGWDPPSTHGHSIFRFMDAIAAVTGNIGIYTGSFTDIHLYKTVDRKRVMSSFNSNFTSRGTELGLPNLKCLLFFNLLSNF